MFDYHLIEYLAFLPYCACYFYSSIIFDYWLCKQQQQQTIYFSILLTNKYPQQQTSSTSHGMEEYKPNILQQRILTRRRSPLIIHENILFIIFNKINIHIQVYSTSLCNSQQRGQRWIIFQKEMHFVEQQKNV